MYELIGLLFYFFVLTFYVFFRKKRALTQQDFVLGSRSLNPLTTALAAHASDMSNWLFMAYPGMVFLRGGTHIWAAIGLTMMMWVNWTLIAPRVRSLTEKTKSSTLVDFFEKRIGKSWPVGRLATSAILFFFYTIYVAGGACGMGLLLNSLFGLPYIWGVLFGIFLICSYVLIGGYLTLAQVDLFQGLFLLLVILFVPVCVMMTMGGVHELFMGIERAGKSVSLGGWGSLGSNLLLMFGWGLGYFGQPHIITKFMGIKQTEDMKISKWIGISWQIVSLTGATLVGLVGIALFQGSLMNQEEVFLLTVRQGFPAMISGIFLCAVIAAILNASSSMLLVLSTTLTEDIYKRFFNVEASSKKLLQVSRLASILAAVIAMGIALMRFATIDQLVLYAWSGLGASIGPLLVMSLFAKKLSSMGAWLGMLVGGFVVILWPLTGLENTLALVVAFPLSLLTIYLSSRKEEVLA